MSILYIAPFFERNALAESATYYVKALSKLTNVTCRPIGEKHRENNYIKGKMAGNDSYTHLFIHGNPNDFIWKGGFKKVVGITHLKNPLIQETDFSKYFSIVDEAYHDSSFQVDGLKNLTPYFDEYEYNFEQRNIKGNFRFLIVGSPTCYEEVFSTVRAFSEEFRCEENVELILKFPESFNGQEFGNIIKSLQNDTRKYNNQMYPPVGLFQNWLPKQDLLKFYNDFDCIINCSLYNRWSRPFVDCLFLNKRCISLIDESSKQTKMLYGPSEHTDYPVGKGHTFSMASTRDCLREAFTNRNIDNKLNKSDFSETTVLPQLMAIINDSQT